MASRRASASSTCGGWRQRAHGSLVAERTSTCRNKIRPNGRLDRPAAAMDGLRWPSIEAIVTIDLTRSRRQSSHVWPFSLTASFVVFHQPLSLTSSLILTSTTRRIVKIRKDRARRAARPQLIIRRLGILPPRRHLPRRVRLHHPPSRRCRRREARHGHRAAHHQTRRAGR